MMFENLNVRGNHTVSLGYLAKPPQAKQTAIWWLQLKKMGIRSELHATAYLRKEPELAARFAHSLLKSTVLAPDLVIVPASSSRQFKPYLDAMLAVKAELPVLDGAFSKPPGFCAGDKGQTYESVLENTVLDETKLPASGAVTRLWIIDDIYNTGNTVGAMLTRLRPHLLEVKEMIVACPLYGPMQDS